MAVTDNRRWAALVHRFIKTFANNAISALHRVLNTTCPTIYKCIDKALSMGVDAAMKDQYQRAKKPIITDHAKAWVIYLACIKSK